MRNPAAHCECGLDGFNQVESVLVGGGQITADRTKHPRTALAAETARNLLLHLDHAQVPLGLVVVERHAHIIGES